MKDSVSAFCSATSVCWLFLIGWLLPWLQEACYCSCRHTSNTSGKDKDRSLSCELFKNERNILRSPCRLPLIFHWPELGYMPIIEPPHVEENAVTQAWLKFIKMLPLGWDKWVGSWFNSRSPETHGQLTPEQREGFFCKIGLLGRPSDKTVDLILMSVGCKIGKGQKSST